MIAGQKFGEWEILELRHEKRFGKQWFHLCKCNCGTIKAVSACHLATGASKSCGCLSYGKLGDSRRTHGMSRTRVHNIWKGIKRRCRNKNDKSYPRYGGSGIDICDSWHKSFESFYHDMGDCPDGYSIDRIDGSKGYYKENCRWADYTTQARNRKSVTNLPKGVAKLPSGRYKSVITVNYKTIYLGTSDTLDEAKKIRLEAENIYWK